MIDDRMEKGPKKQVKFHHFSTLNHLKTTVERKKQKVAYRKKSNKKRIEIK